VGKTKNITLDRYIDNAVSTISDQGSIEKQVLKVVPSSPYHESSESSSEFEIGSSLSTDESSSASESQH
jgi:hypothetical protein